MNTNIDIIIHELIQKHTVLVFMKGEKMMPMCGFSNTVIKILNTFNIEYHTINVLASENIREGIKEFSKWPTIPQVYINGEFIGGADIILQLYETKQLKEVLEKAISS